jgi:uncharacterized membrane protein HdeD (DUF308 family)
MTGTANETVGQKQTVPWWIVFLEGILAVGLGILMYVHPFGTFTAFLAVLGWFLIIEGIMGLIGLVAGLPVASKWWIGLLWGLLSILAGMFVLNQPLINVYVARNLLVYAVAFMLIAGGVTSVATANRWSENRHSKWGITILALLFIILGIILLFTPFLSFYIIMNLAGAFSFTFGVGMIIYSALMRGGLTRGSDG